LTEAEARLANCAACGGALASPASPLAQPTATVSAAPAPPTRRRRVAGWTVGVGAAVALLVALLIWHGITDSRERAADAGTDPAPTIIAKADAAPRPAASPAASAVVPGGERADVAYPSQVASVKAPGDEITEGEVGARAKPIERAETPPKVADERPAPAPAPRNPDPPQMPAFPAPAFGGNLGAQLADNEIDELLKRAAMQQKELEKLFNMARMHDPDLLRAARGHGLGVLQDFGLRPAFPAQGARPGRAAEPSELTLRGDGIGDRDLERLRGQSKLRGLSLAGTAITDGGLEHLRGLKGLRRLNLSGTRITDKGLQALHGLTELRELDLSNTRVTDGGSQQLQKALPNVEITR
jgi:hypothetical protein